MQWNNYQLDKEPLVNIPIKNSWNQEQIICLVDQILTVKKLDLKANISNLERQIDTLVYELYWLTEKEIKIVEGK